MNKNTIWKLVLNQLPEDEKGRVIQQIEESPTLKSQYAKMKMAWSLSAVENRFSDQQLDQKFNNFRKNHLDKSPKSTIKLLSTWLRYAAVIVISITISWSFFQLNDRNPLATVPQQSLFIETPNGQTAKTTLPDGTIVWLNSTSKIEVIAGLTDQSNRQLKLSGEAYFEVTKDSLRPFTVITVQGPGIRVLGTSFNVNAYPGDIITTTLSKGSVELLDTDNSTLALLKPGDQVAYNTKNHQLKYNRVDAETASIWKEGILVFKDESLGTIAPKLERFYNIKIIFKDNELKKKQLSGRALKDYPVEKVLEMFHMLSNINYRIENKDNEITTIYIY